jgi:hypothetical protein
MDFHDILYGDYAVGALSTVVLLNFLQFIIPALWMCKVLRWDSDGAITHVHLHIRDDAIYLDEVISRITLKNVCIECGIKNTFGICVLQRGYLSVLCIFPLNHIMQYNILELLVRE